MSKNRKPDSQTPTNKPPALPASFPAPKVPKHRQCPSCFGGKGGVGLEKWWKRVSGTLVKRCYACNQCGYQWTATVRTISNVLKIESQEVQVEHNEIDDLETR